MSLLSDLISNEFVKAGLEARTSSGYRTTIGIECENSAIYLHVRYKVLDRGEICGYSCFFERNVSDPELLDDVRVWFKRVKAGIDRGTSPIYE